MQLTGVKRDGNLSETLDFFHRMDYNKIIECTIFLFVLTKRKGVFYEIF